MNPKIGYYRDSASQKEIDIVVSIPRGKILIEVKYRKDSLMKDSEAIVEWAKKDETNASILVTKENDDFGILKKAPIMRIPAYAFLYLLGHAEKHRFKKTK
jgi:predicted AAA+ superfamily ATPase